MFASTVTKNVTLPNTDVSVTIRKLSWLQRKDARRASVNASARDLAAMGGAETIAALSKGLGSGEADGATAEQAPADPLALYDQATVLICGIVAWSAPKDLTPDAVRDLDEDVAEFLAREILALTLPSEADRKNAG